MLAGFSMEGGHAYRVYNFCAPEVVRKIDLARRLAALLGRPAVMPAPSLALRQFAEVLMASQKVHPLGLLNAGFSFRFGRLDDVLAHLVRY